MDGDPFRLRFDWTDITPTSARRAQRFSFDNGRTWLAENGVMTLTREGQPAGNVAHGAPASLDHVRRCDAPTSRRRT